MRAQSINELSRSLCEAPIVGLLRAPSSVPNPPQDIARRAPQHGLRPAPRHVALWELCKPTWTAFPFVLGRYWILSYRRVALWRDLFLGSMSRCKGLCVTARLWSALASISIWTNALRSDGTLRDSFPYPPRSITDAAKPASSSWAPSARATRARI